MSRQQGVIKIKRSTERNETRKRTCNQKHPNLSSKEKQQQAECTSESN